MSRMNGHGRVDRLSSPAKPLLTNCYKFPMAGFFIIYEREVAVNNSYLCGEICYEEYQK